MKQLLVIIAAMALLAVPTRAAMAQEASDAAPTEATADQSAPGDAASDAAATDEKADGDEGKEEEAENEEKKSGHGSYEWKFSWGGGFEYGLFFTSMGRWNLHLLEPNGAAEFDTSFLGHHELAFEVAPAEGLRVSAFGGYSSTYSDSPGFDGFYGGLEPAFTVRRAIMEFAAGVGVGYGGGSLSVDSRSGDADLLLVRPFLEARVYPTDYMAVYLRVAFQLMRVLDFTSNALEVREENNRTGTSEHLSEAGPYAAIGFRFGDYPDHVKNVPDTDGDGMRDDIDDCPAEAEDVDQFEDEDGCPEADNDKDGVLDDVDQCKLEPEDKDGWKDEDGCPETDDDNDGDGILNPVDGCPDDAEDIDKFQDEDGCPDNDNDADGIPDGSDKCPLEAGVPEKKGCPFRRVEVTLEAIVIHDKVFFELGKADIKPESFGLLDEVAQVIVANPRIKKIEVQGHTDHKGKAKKNLVLSDDRAKSVTDYLIAKGVEAERLVPKGYGSTVPLVPLGPDVDPEAAAAQNRRVEFVILEQDEVKETVREDQIPENAQPAAPTE